MTHNIHTGKLISIIVLTVLSMNLFAQKTISVYSRKESPMLEFAINDLRNELSSKGIAMGKRGITDADMILLTLTEYIKLHSEGRKCPMIKFDLKSEGFSIKKDMQDKIWVVGADEPGLMYGVFELAEQIGLYGIAGVIEANQNPYMPTRGVKFNIPLDVRTPTYTDPSEACQQNMLEMWSMDFWTEYIDELARDRYNLVSLWNLHAFPSMIKVPEYPDVALDDVYRTTAPVEVFRPVGNGVKYPNIYKNREIIKQITIEDKILFSKK